jgi:hypothetical protein
MRKSGGGRACCGRRSITSKPNPSDSEKAQQLRHDIQTGKAFSRIPK